MTDLHPEPCLSPSIPQQRYTRVAVVEWCPEPPETRGRPRTRAKCFLVATPPPTPVSIGSLVHLHLLCADFPGADFPRDAERAVAYPLMVAGRIVEGRMMRGDEEEYVVQNDIAGAEYSRVTLRIRAGLWRGDTEGGRDTSHSAAQARRARDTWEDHLRGQAPTGNVDGRDGEAANGKECVQRSDAGRAWKPEEDGGSRQGVGGSYHTWAIPGYAEGSRDVAVRSRPPEMAAHTRPMEWSRSLMRRPIKRMTKKNAEHCSPPRARPAPPLPLVSLSGRFAWRPPQATPMERSFRSLARNRRRIREKLPYIGGLCRCRQELTAPAHGILAAYANTGSKKLRAVRNKLLWEAECPRGYAAVNYRGCAVRCGLDAERVTAEGR
ncbi:hypothetical protein OH77DRAFT_1322777 [Trametes cingulata]|nr:hypothetical protein OH77DRAFT_1322777 [Trametes cingulata]